jgi:hypothetical protein
MANGVLDPPIAHLTTRKAINKINQTELNNTTIHETFNGHEEFCCRHLCP